jgi:uncharacterized protein (DUF983 family)
MARRPLLAARAMILHCPHCGGTGLFRHWWAMREACPNCGLSLAAGNRVGANLLNLVAAEFLLMGFLAVVIIRTWPTPPWATLEWAAPLLMLIAPLALYPVAKLLFVAFDLMLHPGAAPDAVAHGIGPDTPR